MWECSYRDLRLLTSQSASLVVREFFRKISGIFFPEKFRNVIFFRKTYNPSNNMPCSVDKNTTTQIDQSLLTFGSWHVRWRQPGTGDVIDSGRRRSWLLGCVDCGDFRSRRNLSRLSAQRVSARRPLQISTSGRPDFRPAWRHSAAVAEARRRLLPRLSERRRMSAWRRLSVGCGRGHRASRDRGVRNQVVQRANFRAPIILGPFAVCWEARRPYTIFSLARAVWYKAARHFRDKTIYTGKTTTLNYTTAQRFFIFS